jgi:hypothetical protein
MLVGSAAVRVRDCASAPLTETHGVDHADHGAYPVAQKSIIVWPVLGAPGQSEMHAISLVTTEDEHAAPAADPFTAQ